MVKDIFRVIKFEFSLYLSSTRIWLNSILFIAIGLISTFVYSLVAREVKATAMQVGAQAGGFLGSLGVAGTLDELYESSVFFVVKHISDCDALIESSAACTDQAITLSACDSSICQLYGELLPVPPLMLGALWLFIMLLPFLGAMLSFDMISSELQHRTASFPLLRISRHTWYLGKLSAHTILIWGLTLLMLLVIIATGWWLLPSFNIGAALKFALKTLLLIMPFSLAYMAVIALASGMAKSHFTALFTCFALLTGLWLINLLGNAEIDNAFGTICHALSYLTPNHYESWLWHPGISGLLQSIGIYSLFALAFTALGILLIEKKNI